MTVGVGGSVDVDESVSALFDWAPEFPCEHSQHGKRHPGGEPAVVHLAYRCPACGHSGGFMMCGPGLAWYVGTWIRCSRMCDKSSPGAEWVVRTIPVGVEA